MSTPSNSPGYGTFGWYELMTSDTAAAKDFYCNLTGWTTQEMPSQDGMHYTVFNVNGAGVAGMLTLPKEAGSTPAWIGYIVVDDVDARAKEVVSEGGKIHKEPTDVPGMLRFSVVIDPQGAPFIIFAPLPGMTGSPQRPAMGDIGTVSWHELMAADLETDFAFYSKVFGWTRGDVHDMGQMGPYQMFNADGKTIGGMMSKPPQAPGVFWNYYIQVESAQAAVDKIKATGGQVFHGPAEVPGGSWIVQGMDPQGGMFSLVSSSK